MNGEKSKTMAYTLEPTPESLDKFMHDKNLPSYRTGQILEWFWKKKETNILKMSNLPNELRQELNEKLYIPEIRKSNKSGDKTVLYIMKFKDGLEAETVLIEEKSRKTVCVSTGVGCPYGCLFCATGEMGFFRQLTPYEIAVQVLLVSLQLGDKNPTNIVLMGMGEPFYDYKGAVEACDILNDKKMLGIGQRKITISTAGVVPGILYLAKSAKQYKLAVSLNASDDSMRKRLMPITKKWNLAALIDSVKEYIEITNKKVTFEYVLIKDINDKPKDAKKLSELVNGVMCKINLIPYNQAVERFQRAEETSLLRFREILEKNGVDVTVRYSHGGDIDAACGQLFTKQKMKRGEN
ncbi:23S rRNA (adenine(2503)-C(2))-methyltransferase RlmN [candidate division WOR-3 bacterium]|nr:23S rRNA (adenine(2503)-C(2))-methyltransferase RlmN [candidate division WOR-3 bacterium]